MEDILLNMTLTKEYLVCVDSDGCVFDNMELKHKECVCPATVNVWGLQSVSRYARESAEFVNLYSKSRGANRFPALVRTLELLGARKEAQERGYVCPDLTPLKKWIEETGYDVFDDIKFEERSYCPETGEYTYYFIAPAEEVLEMFPGKYNPKEVIHAEISIEIPEENEGDNLDGVLVSISPTRRVGDETEDYDWTDIELPDSQVIKLLERGRAKCPAPEQNPKQTAFKVHISEVLGRDVIIYAEDRYEAEEKAEELCNAGIIDLSGGDFGSRTVETIGTADIGDNKLEAYGKEDE